ncbi:MAG: hypothetical protein IJ737_02320 [Ruminococcus sp.]|nr:hypothetical protein [Ruminococcus sp.]
MNMKKFKVWIWLFVMALVTSLGQWYRIKKMSENSYFHFKVHGVFYYVIIALVVATVLWGIYLLISFVIKKIFMPDDLSKYRSSQAASYEDSKDRWICKKCGGSNSNSTRVCSCGESRY